MRELKGEGGEKKQKKKTSKHKETSAVAPR